MHAETLPAARLAERPWITRALTLIIAAVALLAVRPAIAQTFTVGTNLVDLSQTKGNETDPCISIDPLNPSNMVMVSASDGTAGGLFFAYTTNTGGIWRSNFIATNSDTQGLPQAAGSYAQPSVTWDSYGNVFLAYLPDSFEGVAVAVSTNGGSNFVALTNLAALDATDQPRITAPTGGAAAGSVWVVYKDYTTINPITNALQVQGMLSSGLGAFGTFGAPQVVPGSSDGGFADIAVGPYGQVMVAFQDNLEGDHSTNNPNGYPTANIWISVETNALATLILTNDGFGLPEMVAFDAIGGTTYIPAAPTGIGINASPGLTWDYDNGETNYDNVYLVYTAVGPNGNAVISSMFSSDFGTNAADHDTNWSGETYVDDDAFSGFNGQFNDHFMPRVAVDPLSGFLVCSWYDCRNDDGNNSPAITNTITSTFTFTNLTITNVIFTNNPALNVISETSAGNGNLTITITADNVSGTAMSSDGTANIYIGSATNTNFDIYLATTNATSNTKVTVTLINIFPQAYSSGAGNQEAIMYFADSVNGGKTFEPNQQLTPPKQIISTPAVGVASDVAGSSSLTGWGHYTGLAFSHNSYFVVWADNSDATTNNPDGANVNFDIYTLTSGPGLASGGENVANLGIWGTNSPNPVISEGVLIYSLVVTNYGPLASGTVTVTDVLSPYVTLVHNGVTPALGGSFVINVTSNGQEEIVFTLPPMAPNAVLTNTFRVTATTSALDTNYASVQAPSPPADLIPGITTNQLITLVSGEDLAMSMTTSETNVLIGDTVVSWVTVTNLGPATNGPVFITNIFSGNWGNVTIQAQGTNLVTNTPAGTVVIANLGLLSVGQAITATFTALALSGDSLGDTTNASEVAIVTSQDYDTNTANNFATNFFFINGEDLAIGMTSPSTNVDQGVPFTFTINVTNFGLSYSGFVSVTNTLSTNLGQFITTQSQGSASIDSVNNIIVFNLGTLGAGEIASMTITATPIGLPATATDVATVFSTDFDLNQTNNGAVGAVVINGEDLAIGVTQSAPSVNLGQPITFTMNVTNLGLSYTGLVTVTNALSTNLGLLSATESQGTNSIVNNQAGFNDVIFSLGALGIGQTATLTVTATAISGPTAATNIATVSSTDFDLNLVNNGETNFFSVNGENLAVGVSVSPTSQQVGQPVTFTESVTNLGLSTNGVVLVTNTLSAILGPITVVQPTTGYTISNSVVIFNLGTLNAGQVVPITITTTPTGTGSGSDTVKVGSLDFDTNLANNTAKATVAITAALPMISNIVVTPLASSAFITFNTGFAGTAQVVYGLTTNYGSFSAVSTTASTRHSVLLTGLQGTTNYDFQIRAWVNSKLYTTNGSFGTTNTLILNTPDAYYSGLWNQGSPIPGIYGNSYQFANTTNSSPTAWAIYDPFIPASGLYSVYMWYPQNVTFTTNAQVYVTGSTNQFIRSVNETVNGGAWQPLAANMYFTRGTNGTVILYNDTDETNKYLVANAMMWVYDAAQDDATNGTVPAWWANFYFGTNVNGYVNGANSASNGYSIYGDYVLGVVPTNAASTLSFTVSPASGNTVSVTFSPCQGGRGYELQTSADLSQPWIILTNKFTVSTNGAGTFTVTQTNQSGSFYRLSADILP